MVNILKIIPRAESLVISALAKPPPLLGARRLAFEFSYWTQINNRPDMRRPNLHIWASKIHDPRKSVKSWPRTKKVEIFSYFRFSYSAIQPQVVINYKVSVQVESRPSESNSNNGGIKVTYSPKPLQLKVINTQHGIFRKAVNILKTICSVNATILWRNITS